MLKVRAVALPILCFFSSASGAEEQSCPPPPHSHVDRVTQEGKVRTVHCKCDTGYEAKDGRCEVTAALYQSALRSCQKSVNLRKRLQKKMAQLRGWRNDIQRYRQEFEALRADAARGAISDAMDAIPIEWMAPKIVSTATSAEKLKAVYTAAHGAVSEVEGYFENEDHERLKKIVEGEMDFRNSLLAIPLQHESEETQKWVGNLGKIYGTGVKLLGYALACRNGKVHPLSVQSLPETAALAGEIWGLFDPRVAAAVASTKLFIRADQGGTAQQAIANLNEVLAKNWDAEQHLQRKIVLLNSSISEENRAIESYRAFNPNADPCAAD